jgi:isocitrate lyase
MSTYSKNIADVATILEGKSGAWDAINPESAARMRAQNRFKTGLDVAKYTAAIMPLLTHSHWVAGMGLLVSRS